MAEVASEEAEAVTSVMWRSAAVDAFGNLAEPHGDPRLIVPLPSPALREASSTADLALWFRIGEAWAQTATRYLSKVDPVILDIGCGCGKMARFFVLNPQARYIGIDIFRPAILWCQQAFATFPAFRFEHLDVRSELYNPEGAIPAEAALMPVEGGSVDLIICGSLFTHLLEVEFRHYLSELRRCLGRSGRAMISIHNEPTEGTRFSGDATRIDIADDYFLDLVAAAGMKVHASVGPIYGQEVYILERPSRADWLRRTFLSPKSKHRHAEQKQARAKGLTHD